MLYMHASKTISYVQLTEDQIQIRSDQIRYRVQCVCVSGGGEGTADVVLKSPLNRNLLSETLLEPAITLRPGTLKHNYEHTHTHSMTNARARVHMHTHIHRHTHAHTHARARARHKNSRRTSNTLLLVQMIQSDDYVTVLDIHFILLYFINFGRFVTFPANVSVPNKQTKTVITHTEGTCIN